MHVHKNDTVVIISGNFKGKQGKVLKVFPETNRVIVEGVNIVKRHTRASQKNPQGGILQKEGAIHLTLIDPEKVTVELATQVARVAESCETTALMVGGSTLISASHLDDVVKAIKDAVIAVINS